MIEILAADSLHVNAFSLMKMFYCVVLAALCRYFDSYVLRNMLYCTYVVRCTECVTNECITCGLEAVTEHATIERESFLPIVPLIEAFLQCHVTNLREICT